MRDGIFQDVENGGALLTASPRLARALLLDYAHWQEGRGRGAWPTPLILPIMDWVEGLWRAHAQGESERDPESQAARRILLSSAQEQLLWERCIAGLLPADALLSPASISGMAAAAYAALRQHSLGLASLAAAATADALAFREWAKEFEAQCVETSCLSRADLPAAVAGLLRDRAHPCPNHIHLAGFPPDQPHPLAPVCAGGGPMSVQPDRGGTASGGTGFHPADVLLAPHGGG